MIWKLRKRSVDLSRSGLIMGVLNVTPDSFSDGGLFMDEEAAFRHAEQMASEGATILDIGGESSRPGSDPVPAKEELRRVIPVMKRLRSRFPDLFLSIDTYKAETARQALAAGADIVNDISALRADPAMFEVLKRSNAGVILMHMQGTPRTMQINPYYEDVVTEVFEFLRLRRDELVNGGIDRGRIAIDPGYGFGKRVQDNVQLVRWLSRFAELGQPVVVGISRKSPIAQLLGNPKLPPQERLWPTVALTSLLREKGAHVFRVHDVRPNLEALRMTEAIVSDD
jgi:dihydropteroate synthase